MTTHQKYTDFIVALFGQNEEVVSRFYKYNSDESIIYRATTGKHTGPLSGHGADYKITMRLEGNNVVLVNKELFGVWRS